MNGRFDNVEYRLFLSVLPDLHRIWTETSDSKKRNLKKKHLKFISPHPMKMYPTVVTGMLCRDTLYAMSYAHTYVEGSQVIIIRDHMMFSGAMTFSTVQIESHFWRKCVCCQLQAWSQASDAHGGVFGGGTRPLFSARQNTTLLLPRRRRKKKKVSTCLAEQMQAFFGGAGLGLAWAWLAVV